MSESPSNERPGVTAPHQASASPSLFGQPTGRWLVAVRAAWLVLAASTSISFLVELPLDIADAAKVCDSGCILTPAIVRVIASVGVSIDVFLWVTAALSVAIFVVALAMSVMLFVRRSPDWMVLLISLYVLIYPLNNILGSFNPTNGGMPWWVSAISVLIATIGTVPYLIFPSGRFVPRWSWIVLVYWVVFWTAFNVFNLDFPMGYLIGYASLIGCQIYRYRKVSTPVERQQTKWVLLGFVASLVANQAFWTPFYLPPMMPLAHTLYAPFSYLLFQVSLLFVPIAFFIAIQRYQLFDIDVLINRALVYGVLTLLLGGIFAGSVLGLQLAFRIFTAQDTPISLVASTLLITALFIPLRRLIQRMIDRRFYREKYDIAKVMGSFGATLRTEVQLDALQARLVEVVHETMHPAHVSLWLRPKD